MVLWDLPVFPGCTHLPSFSMRYCMPTFVRLVCCPTESPICRIHVLMCVIESCLSFPCPSYVPFGCLLCLCSLLDVHLIRVLVLLFCLLPAVWFPPACDVATAPDLHEAQGTGIRPVHSGESLNRSFGSSFTPIYRFRHLYLK